MHLFKLPFICVLAGLAACMGQASPDGRVPRQFDELYPLFFAHRHTSVVVLDGRDTLYQGVLPAAAQSCIQRSLSRFVKSGPQGRILFMQGNEVIDSAGYSPASNCFKYRGVVFEPACSLRLLLRPENTIAAWPAETPSS